MWFISLTKRNVLAQRPPIARTRSFFRFSRTVLKLRNCSPHCLSLKNPSSSSTFQGLSWSTSATYVCRVVLCEGFCGRLFVNQEFMQFKSPCCLPTLYFGNRVEPLRSCSSRLSKGQVLARDKARPIPFSHAIAILTFAEGAATSDHRQSMGDGRKDCW